MSGKLKTENLSATESDDEYHDAKSKDNEAIIDELLNQHKNLTLGDDNDGVTISDEIAAEEEIYVEDEFFDEKTLKEMERDMTDDEKAKYKEKAEQLKQDGNEFFRTLEYEKSIKMYTSALKIAPTCYPNERAILYANRAAAKIKFDSKKSAIDDCTEAINLNPNYAKAYLRRAKLYEDNEKFDESLDDFKKILELEPKCPEAISALHRLPPIINERNEKLKTEMVGKLKDLGNMILKPFGLSTNNFQMQQDPGTGSYSINFNQGNQ